MGEGLGIDYRDVTVMGECRFNGTGCPSVYPLAFDGKCRLLGQNASLSFAFFRYPAVRLIESFDKSQH